MVKLLNLQHTKLTFTMQSTHSISAADVEEMLPLVDREGKIIGKALRSQFHKDNSLFNPVVHVHIMNEKGELFLQKRSMKKLIQPGKWDTSVGGHITYGEPLDEALRREAWEEAGVVDGVFLPLTTYLWECEREREFINVFKCHYENPNPVAKAEIDDARFWTMDEIIRNIGKGVFTPNFEMEFVKIKGLL